MNARALILILQNMANAYYVCLMDAGCCIKTYLIRDSQYDKGLKLWLSDDSNYQLLIDDCNDNYIVTKYGFIVAVMYLRRQIVWIVIHIQVDDDRRLLESLRTFNSTLASICVNGDEYMMCCLVRFQYLSEHRSLC